MDLSVVRLIRQAIRTADIASGRGMPVSKLGPAPSQPPVRGSSSLVNLEPRPVAHAEPRIEPRPRIHPTPRIEPRPVIHPRPVQAPGPSCPSIAADQPAEPAHHKSPIEPPWKVMPWQSPLPLPAKLKVIQNRPDAANKGTMLDVFI